MSIRSVRRGSIAASQVVAAGGATVLTLPGTSGNYASTPDSTANSITGDLDFRANVALTDWTPGSMNNLVVKRNSGKSYHWGVWTDGSFFFMVSFDGVNDGDATLGGAATGFTDGTFHWVRVTRASASGDIKFYTSGDGSSWTQLGTTYSGTPGSLADIADDVEIGSQNGGTGNRLNGSVAYVELRDGIAGTVVAKYDPSTVTILGTRDPASFVSSTGETWMMNGSAWDWATV